MNDEPISNPSVLAPVGLPSVGGLLRNSLERYREHWKLWVLIVLPSVLLGGLFSVILPTLRALRDVFSVEVSLSAIFIFGAVLGVVQFVTTLALFTAVADPVNVKEAYRRGTRLLIPYLFVGLLSGLIVVGGGMFFVIPGIIFAIWFALAPYIVVSEGTRGMNALLKSKAYVEGYFWSVFGRVFVLILISIAVGLLLNMLAFSGVLPNVVPNVLTSLFFTPFAMIYCFKIYEGLKAIKGTVSDVYTTREKTKYIVVGALGFIGFLVIMAVATVLS